MLSKFKLSQTKLEFSSKTYTCKTLVRMLKLEKFDNWNNCNLPGPIPTLIG